MTFTGVLNKTGSFSSSSVTKHIQKPPTILAACTDLAKMYHVVGSMQTKTKSAACRMVTKT